MDSNRSRYVDKPYALYTRYPRGIGQAQLEAEDLECPACGAQEIVITKEFEFEAVGMKGDSAQCWICKHEFDITEGCWKFRTGVER